MPTPPAVHAAIDRATTALTPVGGEVGVPPPLPPWLLSTDAAKTGTERLRHKTRTRIRATSFFICFTPFYRIFAKAIVAYMTNNILISIITVSLHFVNRNFPAYAIPAPISAAVWFCGKIDKSKILRLRGFALRCSAGIGRHIGFRRCVGGRGGFAGVRFGRWLLQREDCLVQLLDIVHACTVELM